MTNRRWCCALGGMLCLLGGAMSGRAAEVERPGGVPAAYKLVYRQDFEKPGALRDFAFTDPTAWRHGSEDDRGYMELFKKSKYKYVVRSPLNIALIAERRVGAFVLEAELKQTGKEYGHRDMCLFWGFQDPSHFYYVHIASKADAHAHQIFIVDGKPRTKITTEGTAGHKWSARPWHRVRVVRDPDAGSTAVYVNDMEKPIMKADDKTFGAGYVGFGSFDDTGCVSRIRLWAEKAGDKPVASFKRPAQNGQ